MLGILGAHQKEYKCRGLREAAAAAAAVLLLLVGEILAVKVKLDPRISRK